MEKMLATYHNGHVELDAPAHWPEGTRLEVVPAQKKLGLDESEWPQTPEEIAEWLAWFETIEPYDMTAEEFDRMEKERQLAKEQQKQLLRKSWEREDAH
jgi:hypothetical protein